MVHDALPCVSSARAASSFIICKPLQAVWSRFDPKRRGFIGVHRVRDLVTELAAPLGHKGPTALWMRPVRHEVWVVRQRRGVPFTDMLLALLHYRMGPQVSGLPGHNR